MEEEQKQKQRQPTIQEKTPKNKTKIGKQREEKQPQNKKQDVGVRNLGSKDSIHRTQILFEFSSKNISCYVDQNQKMIGKKNRTKP